MVLMNPFAGKAWGICGRSEERDGRTNGEGSINIYTLSGVRWLAGGKPLCSRGSPVWCSVMTWRDGMREQRRVTQSSHSAVFNSLRPHGPQHDRLPCPSPTPRACSNFCPSSQWCHPTISYSVIPFSSHLQSFPASGAFQVSQLFESGGQSIVVSASASVLPMNIQDWFPLGWTGWNSLQFKGLSRSSPTPQFKSINSSALSFLYRRTLTSVHDYWKNHSFD